MVSSTSVPPRTSVRIALPQLDAAAGIEPGRRLVEQQQAGCTDEAGAQVEPPAHPARVAPDEAVGRLLEAELSRAPRRAAAFAVPPAVPEQAGDHHQVLAPGHRRLDRRVLAGQPDDPAHLLRLAGGIDPGHPSGSPVGPEQRGHGPHERGLAGAVRAEHGGHLHRLEPARSRPASASISPRLPNRLVRPMASMMLVVSL